MQDGVYSFGTPLQPGGGGWYAFGFSTYDGFQGAYYEGYLPEGIYAPQMYYALAVRSGDVAVASVPEPDTLLMAVAGLAVIGFVRRRQTVGALAI